MVTGKINNKNSQAKVVKMMYSARDSVDLDVNRISENNWLHFQGIRQHRYEQGLQGLHKKIENRPTRNRTAYEQTRLGVKNKRNPRL